MSMVVATLRLPVVSHISRQDIVVVTPGYETALLVVLIVRESDAEGINHPEDIASVKGLTVETQVKTIVSSCWWRLHTGDMRFLLWCVVVQQMC